MKPTSSRRPLQLAVRARGSAGAAACRDERQRWDITLQAGSTLRRRSLFFAQSWPGHSLWPGLLPLFCAQAPCTLASGQRRITMAGVSFLGSAWFREYSRHFLSICIIFRLAKIFSQPLPDVRRAAHRRIEHSLFPGRGGGQAGGGALEEPWHILPKWAPASCVTALCHERLLGTLTRFAWPADEQRQREQSTFYQY